MRDSIKQLTQVLTSQFDGDITNFESRPPSILSSAGIMVPVPAMKIKTFADCSDPFGHVLLSC